MPRLNLPAETKSARSPRVVPAGCKSATTKHASNATDWPLTPAVRGVTRRQTSPLVVSLLRLAAIVMRVSLQARLAGRAAVPPEGLTINTHPTPGGESLAFSPPFCFESRQYSV